MSKKSLKSQKVCSKPLADKLERKIETLLAKMTLAEKIGQMTLFTAMWAETGPTIDRNFLQYVREGRCGSIFNAYTAEYTRSLQKVAVEETRLGIPLLFGFDVIHGHRSIFPIPLGEACSWDLELMKRSARIAATEAAAEGIHWTFAPMVDIARDPRWGRVAEGAGEDVWLGCRIAEARVRGFQGEDLTADDTVLACAKHFAAYGGAEAGRDYNIVDVSERTLAEVYLPPFKACVDANVRTFMPAFNEIAGMPCTASRTLLTETLRQKWGFTGMVVTDYTAINELIPHGVAADLTQAGQLAIEAGVDMDMQGGVYFTQLEALVNAGKVLPAAIDEGVRRVLRVKIELGLFDDPYRYCCEKREKSRVLSPEHKAAAQKAAEKSMVLLKNEDDTLPFAKNLRSLAVIGPLAESQLELLGNWYGAGDGNQVVSVAAALREKFGKSVNITTIKGCEVDDEDDSQLKAAVTAAKKADAVLLVLGEYGNMSGEAACRVDIDLPGLQNRLAEEVTAAARGKPVAAVLFNGRPLAISRLAKAVPAILEAWFPGTMGGQAIAEMLFGDTSPSGRLVMSFPRHIGQIPIYYTAKNTGRPISSDKYTSKYLDCPNTPLFAFGHGLTYTTFSYGPLRLSAAEMPMNGEITVSITVTNTGNRAGEEVVQLYLRDLIACVTRPLKELKGFKKISLEPGAAAEVKFTITAAELTFVGPDLEPLIEPGEFEVMIGGSSSVADGQRFTLLPK
ncbi:MAG: beta-glucosidase [Candidatus Rifleibacterium amylolyticum]|nr:MAG: beta-glucosidase [Candidatus Rifleibacterium amylolyticum]